MALPLSPSVLINRDWEIFWKSEDKEVESDWYEARILDYNEDQKTYKIHFKDDDPETFYFMQLNINEVRESLRVWRRRSLKLISSVNEEFDISQLPPICSFEKNPINTNIWNYSKSWFEALEVLDKSNEKNEKTSNELAIYLEKIHEQIELWNLKLSSHYSGPEFESDYDDLDENFENSIKALEKLKFIKSGAEWVFRVTSYLRNLQSSDIQNVIINNKITNSREFSKIINNQIEQLWSEGKKLQVLDFEFDDLVEQSLLWAVYEFIEILLQKKDVVVDIDPVYFMTVQNLSSQASGKAVSKAVDTLDNKTSMALVSSKSAPKQMTKSAPKSFDTKPISSNNYPTTVHLNTGSTQGRHLVPAVSRYTTDGMMITADSMNCLHSLIREVKKRKNSDSKENGVTFECDETDFRDKTKSILSKSLLKGLTTIMNIELSAEAEVWCDMLGMELELAMHNFLNTGNIVSREYKAKLRSLKYNLEDVKNPSLCSRVLSKKLSVDKLVKMTPEELANKEVQKLRAKAEEESLKNSLLATGATTDIKRRRKDDVTTGTENKGALARKSSSAVNSQVENEKEFLRRTSEEAIERGKKKEITQSKAKTFMPKHTAAQRTNSMGSVASSTGSVASVDSSGKLSSPSALSQLSGKMKLSSPLNSIASDKGSVESISQNDIIKNTPKVIAIDPDHNHVQTFEAPPSPPRVSSPVVEEIVEDDDDITIGPLTAYAVNQNNSTEFTVRIVELRQSFQCHLCYDVGVSDYMFDHELPQNWEDRGRIKLNEMNRFLHGKLSRPEWKAIVLRISIASYDEVNSSNYKRFYRHFESKDRLAMFQFSGNQHIFVVTPKFIKGVLCLQSKLDMMAETSSYAILLTKQQEKNKLEPFQPQNVKK